MGAADFVVFHIGHVFLDSASNGCLLCCSIAVPAGRLVCPSEVLIAATHDIAVALIGELLDYGSHRLAKRNHITCDHSAGSGRGNDTLADLDRSPFYKSIVDVPCTEAGIPRSALIERDLEPLVWH